MAVALIAAVAIGAAGALAAKQVGPAGTTYKLVGQWGKDGYGQGEFANPNGIAVDKAGDVYVADSDHPRIQVFSAKGAFLREWGSQGEGDGQFNIAEDVNISPDGTVWVADQQNSRLQQFSAAGAFLGAIPQPVSELPRGIAVDKDGRVIPAANGETQSGFRVFIKGANGWEEVGGIFGEGTYRVDDVEASPDGSIYIAANPHDASGPAPSVRRYSADGNLLGSFNAGPSTIVGMGLDLDCNIWTTDISNRRIVKLSPSGKMLATVAVPDLVAKDIAVGPTGDVYVLATSQGVLHFAEDRAKPATALVPARLTATKKVVKVKYTLTGVACPSELDATASLTGKGIAGKAAVKVAAGKATVLTIPLTKAASGPATFTVVLKTNGRTTTQKSAVSLTVSR
jgi:DNA-binding beta-propeller fold protein YncE